MPPAAQCCAAGGTSVCVKCIKRLFYIFFAYISAVSRTVRFLFSNAPLTKRTFLL